jgi:hypothetical protein
MASPIYDVDNPSCAQLAKLGKAFQGFCWVFDLTDFQRRLMLQEYPM